MEKEAFITYLIAQFDSLVEELVPPEEVNFKKYAKEELNPLNKLILPHNLVKHVKQINDLTRTTTTDFAGALKDDVSQMNYARWSWQLQKLFIPILFDTMKKNKAISEAEKNQINTLLNDQLTDIIFQLEPGMKEPMREVRDYVNEKFQISDLKESANGSSDVLYYWEYGENKLSELYDLLLSNDLIEPNQSFVDSFSKLNVPSKIQTHWKNAPASLFALLYLINKRQPHYQSELLSTIAIRLFKLPRGDHKSIRSSFHAFLKRAKSEIYFAKKHSKIQEIISALQLD
jgi:hypothetical protein